MSECRNGVLRDLLPELVNGRLEPEMQRTVESHVAECKVCAEELALLRSLRPALMRGPAIDAQRIAAAVRGQVSASPQRVSPERVSPRPATTWRIAIAAAALLAVSAAGYAIIARERSAAPDVALVHAPNPNANDSANRAAKLAPVPAPLGATPRTAPAPTPPQRVAVLPPHAAPVAVGPTTVVASVGVLDNLADLSDDDVRSLAASLDGISSVPDTNPAPEVDPLGASLDEQSAGGSR